MGREPGTEEIQISQSSTQGVGLGLDRITRPAQDLTLTESLSGATMQQNHTSNLKKALLRTGEVRDQDIYRGLLQTFRQARNDCWGGRWEKEKKKRAEVIKNKE